MKKNLLLLFALITLYVAADNDYHYSVNLNMVANDRLKVSLVPPDINANEIDFMFPAMVPGTYEVYDFGRFISNFTATGKKGEQISIKKINVNTYRLSPASEIGLITYEVDDTFDGCNLPATKNKIIFEPAGSNFEEGKNFVLNNHSLFGYFEGITNRYFNIEFEKPAGFYPSTGLSDITLSNTKDVLRILDYHDLVDSPIMYFKPDTASIQVANTRVLVACYSPNKLINARFIATTLKPLLFAQRDYLGGELPVNKYAFLFYFMDKAPQSGASGALEHSYSSFYVMPEFDSLSLKQQLRDVAAHEFFHIVTPLTIHSKEIGDFDFNKPQMSEHLWLYEGMTEYAAHHAQLKSRLISLEAFLNVMMEKYENSIESYNDTMPFTFMSKHVLDDKIHHQYGNVYEKGALIGMCLDIRLRDLSGGNYGTQQLMKDLATKYGKSKAFNDSDLFNDIEEFTFPEIGKFLRDCVGGGKPLPLQDLFGRVGIRYHKQTEENQFTLGNPELAFDVNEGKIVVENINNLDTFGKQMGYKRGDRLCKLNGKELKRDNLKEVIARFYSALQEGDWVTMEVSRKKGLFRKYKQVILRAKAIKVKVTRKNRIELAADISEKQSELLKHWIR